jgi:type II secretory ATPase GspE/PulE/Tfp pilus assembly ATPase PilB-like protein
MADPRDFMVSEDIHIKTGVGSSALFGHARRYFAGTGQGIRDFRKRQGAELLKSVTDAVIPDVDGTLERVQEKTDVTEVDASAPEVEKIVNGIILSALGQKSSDIHIEPFEDPAGRNSRVLVRLPSGRIFKSLRGSKSLGPIGAP